MHTLFTTSRSCTCEAMANRSTKSTNFDDEQKPGSSTENPFDLTDDTEVKTETVAHPEQFQAFLGARRLTEFNWDDIEVHIDAASLGETRTLILLMSDLKPRTRGTCGWNEFKLATLHHQIDTETATAFDVTRYKLIWDDGTEDFALDKPGRYKVVLKRFSERIPGNENVLHLRVQARYSPEFPVDDRSERTDIVEGTETAYQETTHSSNDTGQ